ncbi:MAG TPA: HD-GYP domain-containing protein [Peptococcaceae bacterium]|nr:HD-GYP domain-containing protein [Peptococcaceae bacterium]
MRLVNINFIPEGSVLAKAVRDANGRVLLAEGVALTSKYLNRLKQLGFDMLFIKDERFEDVDVKHAISDKTKEVAYQAVHGVTKALGNNSKTDIDTDSVRNAVSMIIEDLLCSCDVLNSLTDIHGYDEYTYHHSVNTTVLSLVLGMAKGYNQNKLLEMGMGVLLHDIGKTNVPKQIVNKKGSLSKEDFEEIKKHPSFGFDFVRRYRDFSINSAHVAYQHHEKWIGGGYPRGIKGNAIHEYGRIAAIADVYDALTSKRPYRDALEPNQAYEYVMAQSGFQFDPQIVRLFVKNIAAYPNGLGVLLSNGMRGNVIRQNPGLPNRPVVRVIYNGDRPLSKPIDIDLANHLNLVIVKVENF